MPSVGSPLRPQGAAHPGWDVLWYPAGLGQTGSARPAQPQGLCTAEMGAACQHAVLGGPRCATPRRHALHSSASCHHTAPQGTGTHKGAGWMARNPLGHPGRGMLNCRGGDPTSQGCACSPPGWSVWPLPRSTAPTTPAPALSGTRAAAPSPAGRRQRGPSSGALPRVAGQDPERSGTAAPQGSIFFSSLLPLESVNVSICSSPPAYTQLCSIVLAFGPLLGCSPPSPTHSQALPFPSAPGWDSRSPQFLRQPKLQLVAVKHHPPHPNLLPSPQQL